MSVPLINYSDAWQRVMHGPPHGRANILKLFLPQFLAMESAPTVFGFAGRFASWKGVTLQVDIELTGCKQPVPAATTQSIVLFLQPCVFEYEISTTTIFTKIIPHMRNNVGFRFLGAGSCNDAATTTRGVVFRFMFVLVIIEARPYIESLPIVNDCFHYSRRWRDEERNVK